MFARFAAFTPEVPEWKVSLDKQLPKAVSRRGKFVPNISVVER
jgi:hypothetical protein